MHRMNSTLRGIAGFGMMFGASIALSGCSDLKNSLLDAPDPDVISPSAVNSADAADAMRIGALSRLRNITAGGEGAWMLGGLLVDEWKSSDTFLQRNETDQRTMQLNNGNVQGMLREIYRARNTAREAINGLTKYKPTPTANIGQMFFTMGFAEMTLAEAFCNGTPLGDASTGVPIYGPPQTNTQVFTLALAHLDSAISLSGATDAFSISVKNAAAVTRARVLIDLGRFTDVAAGVAAVPTTFQSNATFSLTGGNNQIWALNTNAKRWTVGDSFDVSGRIMNAIPFASARDPRLPVSGTSGGNSPAGKGFDGSTNWIFQTLWGRVEPTPIVSGLDARLYEAEAKLRANDIPGVMTILNALRSAPPNLGVITPAVMAALPTPASQTAATDLFFREKAFWVFGRGQRHGDLRRLVRQYARTATSVFPSGTFYKGGTYGTDVNFPVTVDEENNPAFKGCIDRNS